MAITVRVQNFQSIEDATVVIDGFTVVTGPNNSGKTALMRAIRGVFTNPPAGALVRHGTAHLTVDIDFGDGNVVVWEKGWEKPGQRGKSINRYTVNGRELPDVGRGCPPEVLTLGVRPIGAGTDTLWPQIADQFTGVLFLVGSPGSAMAEAIANVDRVGKLSTALKLCETERRGVVSTLKVRREDVETYAKHLETYEGLDAVASLVATVEGQANAVAALQQEVRGFESLRDRHQTAVSSVEGLKGVAGVTIPAGDGVKPIRDRLRTLLDISGRLATAQTTVQTCTAAVKSYENVTLPDSSRAVKIRTAVHHLRDLNDRRDQALAEVARIEGELSQAGIEHTAAATEATSLLGELGECPTCGALVAPGEHHEEVA